MAQGDDNQNELGALSEALAPVMTSGANWEDVLASGDPSRYLAAIRSGAPPAQVKAPPLLPATNAPNPPSEAPRPQAIPAAVSPRGTPTAAVTPPSAASTPAASAFARPDPNAIESQLVSATAPQSATNPQGVPIVRDPNHPEYKPGVGRRILRGVVAAGQGLAEGGLRGALLGSLDPSAVGATAYGAGTRPFQQAAQRNQMLQDSLKQQLGQSATNAETSLKEAQAEGATLTPITQPMADANPAFQPFVGTSLSPAALKTIAPAAIRGQAQQAVADTNADSRLTVQQDKDAAQKGLRDAQTDLDGAKADLARAGNDPSSPAYKLALRRAQTAQGNMAAAQIRANAYALNANAGNLGIDNQGNQIEGGVSSAAGNPVGSRFAPTYVKQEGKVAQFNDVGGALDNLEKAAKAMVAKGQHPDNALVAGALAQPHGTAQQWLQGQVAKSNLTPEQRDYVTNLVAAHENIQALRQSAGGGVSDAQVNRLVEMLPNASSPDLDYILRQTGQIRQTASRLAEGVPQTKGGHTVKSPAAPAASTVPPKSIVDAAKVGQYIHGPGGVSYQKKADGLYDGSGKKVEVK